MSELYGFKKNLEKVQVRSKSESAAKSHIVPTLIDKTEVVAPATKYEFADRTIPELANWNVVVLECTCANVSQNLIFFRAASVQNYIIDALSSIKTRGGYYVDWANNRIRVRWVNGDSSYSSLVPTIRAVYGLVQNVDVVDPDTEDEPSGDDGEDIDITGLTEEVQGIRIGADGTIYETAGEAVREQYNKLAEMLDVLDVEDAVQTIQNAVQTIQNAVDTAIEQIETAGGLILDPTLSKSGQAADAKVTGDELNNLKANLLDTNLTEPTIVDKKYVKYDNGTIYDTNSYCYLEASNISTYRRLHVHTNITGAVGICFYDADGTFISGIKNTSNTSPYLFDEDVDVPDGAYIIRVSCLRANRTTLSINTTLKTMLDGINDVIDDNKLDADERISGIKKLDPDLFVSSEMWEMGGVNGTNGALVTSNTYIRTGYIDVTSYKKINVVPNDGYRYAFAFYDTNKNPVGYSGAATNPANALPRNVDVPSNAVYFLIAVGNTSGTAANLDYADEIAITGIYILLDAIDTLEDALGIDSGNTKYAGDKIVLSEPTQNVYSCTINQWLDFADTSLSSYLLHLNQSMAIYGGYVFLFQDGGTVTVLDYETKEIVGMYTTPITETNHQNGAQFSNIFYDNNDEFPLLFVSRASTMPNNECLIYRVQRNNTTFTFTLVNTINVTPVIFQPTWAIDNRRNVITALAYTSANYGIETNNFIKVRTWAMPTKAEILSGNAITLNITDALLEIGLPYAAYQQCIMHNGDIYLCYQPRTGGRMIYHFDGFSGMLLSTVAMPDTVSEMEGLYVYNGKMYVTQKRGTDTEANNPLTIYEITF